MIFDSLKNAELYYSLSPRFKAAFDYINTTDLGAMEAGKYEVDGKNIFVNIMERELKAAPDAKIEVHNNYADIQVVVSGAPEGFGYTPRHDLMQPIEEFNTEKDIQFFADTPQTTYFVHPGQFTILLPEDGHAPLIGSGVVKKAVVKVLL